MIWLQKVLSLKKEQPHSQNERIINFLLYVCMPDPYVCFAAEGELVDGEGKSDSSPEREPAADDESKGAEACKKRKRKPYRPGEKKFLIGGDSCSEVWNLTAVLPLCSCLLLNLSQAVWCQGYQLDVSSSICWVFFCITCPRYECLSHF